jgi:MtN3 and saliva related transmembrane protein
MRSVDLIGWLSSAVLLATIARQVFTQWRTGSAVGVSRWLFIGQLAASTGFTLYSYLLQNWVFLVSNLALLLTAVIGEIIYVKNKDATRPRRQQSPHFMTIEAVVDQI